jgi:UDP-glucose 4-epimerase
MKILVTGGAGFIGHHLSNTLYSMGHDVHVLDNLSTGKQERLVEGIKFQLKDLLVDELPDESFDAVFHLAAPTSVQESLENPDKYKEGCYQMTINVVDWAETHNVKYFTFASTAAVYGPTEIIPTKEDDELNPISPYAEYKLFSEQYLKTVSSDKLQITVTRFFNVFGEEQPNSGSYAPAVAIFLKQFAGGEPITVTGDGEQTRDYIYVRDLVDALMMTIEPQPYEYNIYNIGSGNEIKIIDIAKTFNHEIKFIEARKEPKRSLSNIEKIEEEYGWEPKTNIIEWLKIKL